MSISRKEIREAATRYMQKKVRMINKNGRKEGAMRIESDDEGLNREYCMWVNEDEAFKDGALWALKKMGVR